MAPTLSLRLKRPEIAKKDRMNGILLSFLLGCLGAFFIFLPFLVVDKGFFIYCGDYNAQQIPFYTYVSQFIKNGGGTWSWATDLGTSAITSYSFYNIGSPFLWLTLLFPSRWIPFLMVPLFMLKFGGIAAAANLYFARYAKSRNMAVICSLIYAFCGFNVYNTFFNHMLDPVVIFPLMMWAMDSFVMDNKRGYFALFVGLSLINSYFFFLGNVLFLVLYFFVKVLLREYRITDGAFGLLLLEAVIGVGIGMVLALPSLFNLIGNPRTADFASGFGMVMYGNVQQYFAIFTSLLFPPDPPYMPNLFTEGAIKWTSMSAFLPIVSISGVIAYFKGRKKSSTKTMLIICLIMACVPFLNSAFYAFNASYYARWYYMPVLLMCFATLRSLEDDDIDLLYGIKAAAILTGLYVIYALLPNYKDNQWTVGVAQYSSKFWLTFLTAMLGIGIFYVLVRYYKKSVRFAPLLMAAVLAFSVFYSVMHISLGKFPQWDNDSNYRTNMYDASGEIELPDDHFYRIDAFSTHENLGLWLDKSCLQTFNSVVTPSIMEFYPMVGVKRDVSSKPEASVYALRGLLSVEYTLVPLDKMEVPIDLTGKSPLELGVPADQYSVAYYDVADTFDEQLLQLDWAQEVPFGSIGAKGWTFDEIQSGYAIFRNQNYLPLGFTYDKYILMDDLWLVNEMDRAPLLVRGIGLTEAQEEEYGHLFTGQLGERQEPAEDDYNQNAWYQYDATSYTSYVDTVEQRRATASYETSADASGFTVKIDMDKENLVFFSVPYDAGFTATVNGVDTPVLKVSGGMMAVAAPAGDNTIVFTYKTPGFGAGIAITAGSLAVLVIYLILIRLYRKKKREKALQRAETKAAAPTEPDSPQETDPPAETSNQPLKTNN